MDGAKINIKGSQMLIGNPYRSGANSKPFHRERSAIQFADFRYLKKGSRFKVSNNNDKYL
jgi:hypothetical protein